MTPLVSIAMISRNMARPLMDCLQALRAQTFKDFEVVLVDDRSGDGTKEAVEKLSEPRLRYFRNDRPLGYGAARNLSLSECLGKYVFFTDADCVPEADWLESGLAVYEEKKCIGIVGKTLPLENAAGRAYRRVVNLDGRYMTCNMSFTSGVLKKLGGFDAAFDVGQEDVELGLRARRHGEIVYSERMIVRHQVDRYTAGRFFTDARRYKTQVMIFKRYPRDEYHRRHSPPIVRGIFLKPEDWWIIFCPFLLLRSPSNRTFRDFAMIPLIYLAALYRRWIIWKTAVKERILLI